MLITHDYSFIRNKDQKLIENGYGKIGVYAFMLNVHYSEEQMEENLRTHGTLTAEEWNARGDEYRLGFYESLMPVLKMLHENHYLYQFEKSTDIIDKQDRYSFGNFDLFFYSNRTWNGKDYFDHVSLSINEKKSDEENAIIISDVLAILGNADISCASCRVQYHAILDTLAIKQAAEVVFNNFNEKTFIKYCGMDGKFKRLDGKLSRDIYGFFKKNSRGRYYPVEPKDILLQTM